MRRRSFFLHAFGVALSGTIACTARALGEIAYAGRDGLWIRKLPNGEPRRLLSGNGISFPRFSPSAEWIAYRQQDGCFVVSRDGKQRTKLGSSLDTESAPFRWFPHDDALVMGAPEALQIVRAENHWTPTAVIPQATLPVVFSPDGSEMVYSDVLWTTKVNEAKMPIRSGRLWRKTLSPRKSEPQLLHAKMMFDLIPCAWSPEGKRILYWEDEDFSGSIMADGLPLSYLPAAGGPARSLGLTTLVYDDFVALSPVGNKLALTAGERREDWTWKWIEIIDLNSMSRSRLTELPVVAVCPAWSPTGERIAYSAAPPPAHRGVAGGDEAKRLLAQRKIWITDASGTGSPKQLTRDPEFRDEEPIWCADGEHLLFCRLRGSNHMTLWTMNTRGADLRQITGPLTLNATFLGDDQWFGYYGWIDWRSIFDFNRHVS